MPICPCCGKAYRLGEACICMINDAVVKEAQRNFFDYCKAPADVKRMFTVKKVVFSAPATIVLWGDGTKTVVKCGDGDKYDPEKGLAMAVAKKAFGNSGKYYNVFKKAMKDLPKEEETDK